MADSAVFNETISNELDSNDFVDKTLLYVSSQNQAFNGSIQFDTSYLSNSKRHLDYQNAFIEIPYLISVSSSVSAVAASVVNGFSLGLKAGYFQIIDGMQVDFQNANVIQSVAFSNFAVSYRLLESWSQDDLKKRGTDTLFIPDTSSSTVFQSAASPNGIGHCNNKLVGNGAWGGVSMSLEPANGGLFERCRETGYDLSTANVSKGYGNLPALSTSALCNTVGRSYLSDSIGAADETRIWKFNVMAKIMLRDLHDFFEKIPLLKGAYLRFNINYNACKMTIPCLLSGTTMGVPTYTQLAGKTCPIMISSGATSNPNAANLALANHTLTIEANVASTTAPAATHNIMSTCRLYVPSYQLTDAKQRELYALMPTKRVRYQEVYNFPINSVAAGGSFNAIITNGISNPTKLVVIPVINSADNGAVNPVLSPYDSAGSCGTTPGMAIANFNVLVSGKAIYQQNVNYDFEMFSNEISELGLNGGKTVGLNSGLISRLDWNNGMRYYVVNLSRRPEVEKQVPVSIQVQGTNNTAVIADYYCFLFYEKSIELNLDTADIIQPMGF